MRILGCAVAVVLALPATAQLPPDSIPQVRVTLLDVAPGPEVYSAAGHMALRLECPSQGLDFVFSYEMTVSTKELLRFIHGEAHGGYLAAPTSEYLAQYAPEHRQVTAREINLTPRQKQELWRWLDTEIVKQMPYRYDYAHNMCSTMALIAVENSLGDESIEWGEIPLEGNDLRTAIRWGMKEDPWSLLFWDTIYGEDADRQIAQNLCPELMLMALSNAHIVATDSQRRSFFASQPQVLLPGRERPHVWFTPWLCFALILGLSIILTALSVMRKGHRWRWITLIYDILLFGATGLIGLALWWMMGFSQLVATDWNWLAVPFCPLLPLLAIACRRYRRTIWAAEGAITTLCIPLAIVIPQFASPWILIFASMALRAMRNSRTR